MEKAICIIDVKNEQQEYAQCLEFIKLVQAQKTSSDEYEEELNDLADKMKLQIAESIRDYAPRYLEEPIDIKDSITQDARVREKDYFHKQVFTFEKLKEVNQLHYHIRIHFNKKLDEIEVNYSELVHLQYFALMLMCLDNKGFISSTLKKKISVFIVPNTGDTYPFKNKEGRVDFDTYILISHYLRLLSKKYTGIIYGVTVEKEKTVIKALNFQKATRYETYLPVIPIDEKRYGELFVNNISTQSYKELFALKSRGRFRNSRDKNPMEGLADFCAETALKHIRRVIGDIVVAGVNSSKMQDVICDIVVNDSSRPLMRFCLFAFILSLEGLSDEKHFRQVICDTWDLAGNVYQGLRQIVQNSVQYSQLKSCIFSFCFHKSKENEGRKEFGIRMGQNYPNTEFTLANKNGVFEALEIFVSDLNETEDMLDSFEKNLRNEIKAFCGNDEAQTSWSGHYEMIDNRDKLAVRNFFSEFEKEDCKKAWVAFRRQDLVAHVGLSLLALTAKKCKASVRVLSSKQGIMQDAKHIYYKAYSSETEEKNKFHKVFSRIIPGTQIALLIPVNDWVNNDVTNGLGQLILNNGAKENYAGFANYIDYIEDRDPIIYGNGYSLGDSTKRKYSSITDAGKKNRLVARWRDEIWKLHIKRDINMAKKGNYVFNHDFSLISDDPYFESQDYIEVCLKGLIGAFNVLLGVKEKMIIALTNLPDGFVDQFCRIVLLMGIREFPINLQLCLCEKKLDNMVVFIGKNFTEAICNSYILSMEYGVMGFRKEDYALAKELSEILLPDTEQKDAVEFECFLSVFPFDTVLRSREDEPRTLFEERIQNMAENSLDQGTIGYKLDNTHMRLGSKVHIESFYEMSFLFYRTTIANRIAFLIIRNLAGITGANKKDSETQGGTVHRSQIDLKKDNIIFYGYASYSKAILTSIIEILRFYREESDRESVAFASYQHNLQAESERIQMYFGVPQKFMGSVDEENRLSLKEDTYIVQIVPISSTLTTFDKMWLMFQQQMQPEMLSKIHIYANYTVFWVIDSNGELEQDLPSDTEKKYREKVEEWKGRRVQTKFSKLEDSGCKEVDFFMRNSVKWHDPLMCELCYPEKVLAEIPLVETDVTSTVPTQQIRPPKLFSNKELAIQKDWQKENNIRLLKLDGCVFYGHICRRQNHYQYYIDTQRYFYIVKEDVMVWLNGMKRDDVMKVDVPTLNIIFSPEHNTNVGFAQYVNTYYFEGMAEIVSLNVDKEFRSNFICEHGALLKMIQELHRGVSVNDIPPIRFYFVDDTIISGETFQKANSFLHSLIPTDQKEKYQANLFNKIFLLVDRLSNDTKSIYVKNQQENFLSFAHVDVSNVRTQGDSCIGCKLEQNANRMFKRSVTKTQAAYWANKMKGYRKLQYDDKAVTKSIDKKKSFNRLLITHVLQNLMVKSKNASDEGVAYEMLLNICLWMLTPVTDWKDQMYSTKEERDLYGYSSLLDNVKGIEGVKIVLKVVCRPFFLFDFKIRKQVLTFYIFWVELLLGKNIDEIVYVGTNHKEKISSKLFLYDNNRIALTCKLVRLYRECMQQCGESEVIFLRDYLLEGLTDMGSTYLLRKQTLKSIYDYLGEKKRGKESIDVKERFWDSYVVNIQRLLTSSADETKELWLEYLYVSGLEYREFRDKYGEHNLDFQPVFLYETISGKNKVTEEDYPFYHFCHDVFFHNMGVNFDGLERMALQKDGGYTLKTKYNQNQTVNYPKYEYFLEYWAEFRNLDSLHRDMGVNRKYPAELQLFNILKEKRKEENGDSVDKWYDNLLSALVQMIHEKYDVDEDEINIAVVTENIDENEYAERIQSLNIVKEKLKLSIHGIPTTRYEIRNRIIKALEKNDGLPFELEKNGYTICEWKEGKENQEHYLIIFFDNPTMGSEEQLGRSLEKIERVFLYIGIGKMNFDNETETGLRKKNFYLKMILRDVLSYRNRILKFLESDFSGEIFSRYARTVGEKNIVSHEKANSHNTTADDEVTIEMFVRPEILQRYDVLDEMQMARWLLLRNYTNGQIAKIFNRSFASVPWDLTNSDEEIPPLYVEQESTDGVKELFCQKLDSFSRLQIEENSEIDKRFELLRQVVDIECEGVTDAEFISNECGEYYNLEYFKCIVIDICISAIKYASSRPDFLLRVDDFLHMKKTIKDIPELWSGVELIQCKVKILREHSEDSKVDYLVFRNLVDKFSHELDDWEERNKSIQRRLTDPLDYIDGHMSLLAIKRYIENIDKEMGVKCVFQYVQSEDNEWELYFETKLPVLKRRE